MRNTDHTSSQDETKEKAEEKEKEKKEKEKKEKEVKPHTLKSNNPRLTGGEKNPKEHTHPTNQNHPFSKTSRKNTQKQNATWPAASRNGSTVLLWPVYAATGQLA